ncbi:MAG: transglycosylase SLT domain-containing protein [Bdellovibrionales bacterium]
MGSQISTANAINSLIKQADNAGASSRVIRAIQNAAAKTGVDFSYLLQKASQESSFDPLATATTSSATGLFQFTNQTWLQVVKNYGDQYGLGNYAAQITSDSDGRLTVENSEMRKAILALRKDPNISAEMAGELDKENAAALQQKVGGKIGGTELYLAHFLGAGGASSFIRELRNNPKAAAAEILPTAAAANQSVFYAKTGEARSLQQIYQRFSEKFDSGLKQVASLSSKASTTKLSELSPSANITEETSTVSRALAVTNAISSLHLQTGAENTTLASNRMSTLFNAMIFGQIQDMQLNTTSSLSIVNQEVDGKRKNANSILSAAA